jgi:hypothetical protein
MKLFHSLAAVFIVIGIWFNAAAAWGGVVVVANRTAAKIDFHIVQPDGSEQPSSIKPQDVMPIPVAEKIGVVFESGGVHRYLLLANSIYYFVMRDEKTDLIKFPLLPVDNAAKDPAPARVDDPQTGLCIVTVKLLVDQNEPAVQQVWEKRLRDRLKEASDIFERSCRVRFEAVAVGTWEKNNAVIDFDISARDFESKVSAAPARLAIGFTSHFRKEEGRVHMGGTRGPLRQHILIREWPQFMSNAERLEILVHELGHFLGAAHSPDGDSVMRPVLGDRRANARDFRIGLDPINTLVTYLMGEQLRSRPVNSLAELTPQTKAVLRSAYKTLDTALPSDPAASLYLKLLDPTVPGKQRSSR